MTLYAETKWLRFWIDWTEAEKSKTVVIDIRNKSDQCLGSIRWYGPWRQYVFDTNEDATPTFNNHCLQSIVDVLTHLNDEHKRRRDQV